MTYLRTPSLTITGTPIIGSAADVKAARDALDAITDFQATAIMRDRADAMTPCDQLALGDLISRSAHMRDRENMPNTFSEIELEGGDE